MSKEKPGELPLPSRFLARFSAHARDIWKNVDIFRHDLRQKGPGWDARVFLPFNDWFAFIDRFYRQMRQPELRALVARLLASLSAWRPTQDIIRFDPDLYASLLKTGLTGRMPAELLQRLPAWGIYVEAPGLEMSGRRMEGFFASLELCNDPDIILLNVTCLDARLDSSQFFLPIGDWSVREAVDRRNADFIEATARLGGRAAGASLLRLEEGLTQILNLLIYICAYGLAGGGADAPAPGATPRPAPRKVRGIWRLFPPDRPVIRKLGGEFGELIRRHDAAPRRGVAGAHASPRPHLRRAHWHGYWQGSDRKEAARPRQFQVRWLPPIPVGRMEEPEAEAEAAGSR